METWAGETREWLHTLPGNWKAWAIWGWREGLLVSQAIWSSDPATLATPSSCMESCVGRNADRPNTDDCIWNSSTVRIQLCMTICSFKVSLICFYPFPSSGSHQVSKQVHSKLCSSRPCGESRAAGRFRGSCILEHCFMISLYWGETWYQKPWWMLS